jgi:hypothetical protein
MACLTAPSAPARPSSAARGGPRGRRLCRRLALRPAQALIRSIPVIPILVDGAHMPGPRNALALSPGRFGSDLARLMSALEGQPRIDHYEDVSIYQTRSRSAR